MPPPAAHEAAPGAQTRNRHPSSGLAVKFGPQGKGGQNPVLEPPYRGTSLIRNRPPPQDPPRTLGIGLRYGPRGVRFLVSEVPCTAGWGGCTFGAWPRRAVPSESWVVPDS